MEAIYPDLFSPSVPEAALLEGVRRRTGLSAADLAMKFDSLGNDCEFGFVQRACGAEMLGLFRFSNPCSAVILRAIEQDFVGFGDNAVAELDSQQPRREWIVIDRENGLRQHTYIFEGDQPETSIRAQQLKRFRFLRARMADNIRDGGRIFVIKSGNGGLAREHVVNIAHALRRRGPAWLLWVEQGIEVGRTDILMPGLLHATIDRLTVQPHGRAFSLAGWLAVLSEAWLRLDPLLAEGSALKQAALLTA